MASSDLWVGIGSVLASLLVIWSLAKSQVQITLCINKVIACFNPYMKITIPEYGPERFQRSDFFVAIEAYLSDTCARRARKLKVDLGIDSKKPQASVDDEQQIVDTFRGAKLWWYASKVQQSSNVISWNPGDTERRYYQVAFHCSFRDMVLESYMSHVLEEGRCVIVKNRKRRLFTNNPSSRRSSSGGHGTLWSHVAFKHPATFGTLAMDPTEKQSIIDDLNAFKDGEKYYEKVGKAWKRGYLLYGPPGTGKTTMIAAMAKHMDYDVYDLELTAVKNNTELRKLFIETTGKSIIVIEDIDCSLDLTGNRKAKKTAHKKSSGESEDGNADPPRMKAEKEEEDDDTRLTLSGVLNFIDGLWSACGGERIFVFTTNNKDNLDPALIRQGRMDKHINMSYCRYEAFKVLASNYLDITGREVFEKYGEIQRLLEETDMSPAEVAENLIPVSTKKKDPSVCLEDLVMALKNKKKQRRTRLLQPR